jgi:hypothetical protein
VRDPKLFARIVTDNFLGETLSDSKMAGNPYTWDRTDWKLPNDFQVSRDFPSLTTWTGNLSGVLLNQSFRHERARTNIGEASLHDNFQIGNNANNATIQMQGRSSPSAENSANSGVVLHQTPLHYLKDILPDTPHNIYIIHALRRYRDEMTHRLFQENPHHRSTESYTNNKKALWFLLKQLTLPNYIYFNQIIALLYTLPFKCDDLDGQTSDINDTIRIIRDDNGEHSCCIPYITTNSETFNDSQASIICRSPRRVSNLGLHRSCD